MNEFETEIYYAELFATYGKLLTEKQQEILSAYFSDGATLTETAQILGVTRQTVYMVVSRSKAQLLRFEETLKVFELRKRAGELSRRAREALSSGDIKRADELIGELGKLI